MASNKVFLYSKENEPDLEWNHKMHALFQEMLHYRNRLCEEEPDPVIVGDFVTRYDELLDKATEEYEAIPSITYCREGYNLSVRLREYKESELLFYKINGCLRITPFVKGLPGFIKESKNRRWFLGSRKV